MRRVISILLAAVFFCGGVAVSAENTSGTELVEMYAERDFIELEFNTDLEYIPVTLNLVDKNGTVQTVALEATGKRAYAKLSEKLLLNERYGAVITAEDYRVKKTFMLKSYFSEDFEDYDNSDALYENWISGANGADAGNNGALSLITEEDNKKMKMSLAYTAVAIPRLLFNTGSLNLKKDFVNLNRFVFEGETELLNAGSSLQCGLAVGNYYGNGLSAPYITTSADKMTFYIRNLSLKEDGITYLGDNKSMSIGGFYCGFKTSVNGNTASCSVTNGEETDTLSFSYDSSVTPAIAFKTRGTNAAAVIDNLNIYAYEELNEEENTQIFVSPMGDDNNSGDINNPLKTIQGARDKIRSMENKNTDITVYLRGGEYDIDRTVDFTQDDSGNVFSSITYKAYENEKPVLKGGKSISSDEFLKVGADEAQEAGIPASSVGKIYKYDLKQAGITADELDYNLDEFKSGKLKNAGYDGNNIPKRMSVSIDDVQLDLARYPNKTENEKYPENPYTTYLSVGDVIEKGSVDPQNSSLTLTRPEFKINYENAKNWKNTDDILISGAWCTYFFYQSFRVAEIDNENMTVKLASADSSVYPVKGSRYFFENVLSELDCKNEYYITREGIIYVYSEDDFKDKQVKVTTFSEKYFLNFNNCSNISFEGICFDMTKGSFIKIMGGEYIDIKNCEFKNCSGMGVSIGQYGYTASQMIYSKPLNTDEATGYRSFYQTGYNGKNHSIYGCEFLNTGYPACEVKSGNALTLEGCNFTFENNIVKKSGIYANTYGSGLILTGADFDIRNNKFMYCLGSAISGSIINTNIVYNEFCDCLCSGLEDMGIIYINYQGSNLGVKIRYNYFHDTRTDDPRCGSAPYAGRTAVYYDNGDMYKDMQFNLIESIPMASTGMALYPNYYSNNIYIDVENVGVGNSYALYKNKGMDFEQIIALPSAYPKYYYTVAPPAYENITVWEESFPQLYETLNYMENEKTDFTQTMTECYNNLFVNISLRKKVPEYDSNSMPVDEKYGRIYNNTYYDTDIGFADYSDGDFQLLPSRARELGVEYQDYSKIGIYTEKAVEDIGLRHIGGNTANTSKVFDFNEGVGIESVYLNGRKLHEYYDYYLNYDVIDNNGAEQKNRLMINADLFACAGEYRVYVKSFYGTSTSITISVNEAAENEIPETYFKYGKYIGDLYSGFISMVNSGPDANMVAEQLEKIKDIDGIITHDSIDSALLCEKLKGNEYADMQEFYTAYESAKTEFKYSLTAVENDVYERTGSVDFIFDNTASDYDLYINDKLISKEKYSITQNTLSVNDEVMQMLGEYDVRLESEEKVYCGKVKIHTAVLLYDDDIKYTVASMTLNYPDGKTLSDSLDVACDEKLNYVLSVTEEAVSANAGKNPLDIAFGIDKRFSIDYIYDDVLEIQFKLTAEKFGNISLCFGNNINFICNYSVNQLGARYPYGHFLNTQWDFNTKYGTEFKLQYNPYDLQMRIWYKNSMGEWEELGKYSKTEQDEKYSDDYITLKDAGALNSLQIIRNAAGTAKIENITVKSQLDDMERKISMLDLSDKEAVSELKAEYDDMTKFFSEDIKSKIDNSSRLLKAAQGDIYAENVTISQNLLSTDVYNINGECRIFAGMYDGDRFIELSRGILRNASKYDFEFENNIENHEVRLFVWSEEQKMRPLTERKILQ